MASATTVTTGNQLAQLNYNAPARKEALLDKLGGNDILHKAVDMFYDKLIVDPKLKIFFIDNDIQILKWHQFNFMSVAFAHVPDNFDITDLILNRHKKLFDQGMDTLHFDLVLNHFRTTLIELNIQNDVVDEAVNRLKDYRPIFAHGASLSIQRHKQEKFNKRIQNVITLTAVVAGIAVFWLQKHHGGIRQK